MATLTTPTFKTYPPGTVWTYDERLDVDLIEAARNPDWFWSYVERKLVNEWAAGALPGLHAPSGLDVRLHLDRTAEDAYTQRVRLTATVLPSPTQQAQAMRSLGEQNSVLAEDLRRERTINERLRQRIAQLEMQVMTE